MGDYPATLPAGAIAVVDDARCSVVDKQNSAKARGVAALIVVSAPSGQGAPPNLFQPLTMPVAVVGSYGGNALARTTASVRLVLDAENINVTTRNVLAQTKTGSTKDVIMVGAHLDGPCTGPGINDNGSGVAAVLETALQVGPLAPVNNAVWFVFWGADEDGLNGVLDYVFGLNDEQLNDIAMYLNFNLLGLVGLKMVNPLLRLPFDPCYAFSRSVFWRRSSATRWASLGPRSSSGALNGCSFWSLS